MPSVFLYYSSFTYGLGNAGKGILLDRNQFGFSLAGRILSEGDGIVKVKGNLHQNSYFY